MYNSTIPLYESLICSHDYDGSAGVGILALCGWVSVRVRACVWECCGRVERCTRQTVTAALVSRKRGEGVTRDVGIIGC